MGWQPCLKVSTITNFKISIKNQSFIVFSGLKCEKLANNVIKVTNMGPSTCFSKKVKKSVISILKHLLIKRCKLNA